MNLASKEKLEFDARSYQIHALTSPDRPFDRYWGVAPEGRAYILYRCEKLRNRPRTPSISADLIIEKRVRLLRRKTDFFREKLPIAFPYIMVDEYQDTPTSAHMSPYQNLWPAIGTRHLLTSSEM